jgi:hypothetical protein
MGTWVGVLEVLMRLSLARSSPSRQADRTFPVLRLTVTVNDGYTGELPGAVAARLAGCECRAATVVLTIGGDPPADGTLRDALNVLQHSLRSSGAADSGTWRRDSAGVPGGGRTGSLVQPAGRVSDGAIRRPRQLRRAVRSRPGHPGHPRRALHPGRTARARLRHAERRDAQRMPQSSTAGDKHSKEASRDRSG